MKTVISAKKYNDLIFDVGMYKGEDTEFYLKKGFRVISFEANPELIIENRLKFSENILKKELIIVEGAIIENYVSEKVTFYKNLNNRSWGTTNFNWVKRNEKLGTKSEAIEVNAVNFSKCIEKYGMPYYMKIDIEGEDIVCLKQLLMFDTKPSYISIESNKISFEKIVEEISLLEKLGFSEFIAVQQGNVYLQKVPYPSKEGLYVNHRFPRGSSGLFGKELKEKWKSKDDILEEFKNILWTYKWFGDETFWKQNFIAKTFLHKVSILIGKPIPGWHDIHAKHSSEGKLINI